ncbi:bifunctional 2-polyprenyl-6-hydroxyphenol methylase/3-demethylubiquinol 3-O-methyltransferase UbiG [Candidatus Erwinia haradaeae]|uniref:Ubiquinone biosynthesis O-methyltransferase n=1 Tax=Candidatus Erwinia haradaeae TaxID=1922217 RepID=A0A451DGR2_9GAMM|nr:bifunctional 2-polyprenyl-6-hydroxyphenol methylase/3-demethylubiquinol 3-O-methyltransferase UbiG [Candidatus Erwinia haradaeae]VFP85815.1 Ubiquinone biosynthesis O-methyltransferase [Candidatus Erwinia haradaeae]
MTREHLVGLQNIDNHEIMKFSRLASSWWDVKGPFQPLHSINLMRLEWIIKHTNGLFGKNILDVGCGGGILAESMAREGANVTGLDMSEELLQAARLHALENDIKIYYIKKTVEAYAEQFSGQYEVVTCMEMLEHVPDPYSIIYACARLVKPCGSVFFSTLNRTKKSWLIAILGAEYILKILPRGTHNIKKLIRPNELLEWIDKTPLCVYDMVGLCYNPFSNYCKLTSNVDVNYMVYAQYDINYKVI